MSVLDDIRRPVEKEIEGYNDFLAQHMVSGSDYVAGVLNYVFENGGKGIRPLFVMLGAALHADGRGLGTRTFLAAMLVEMMHTASLVHDDVIDESDMRRGKPSLRAKFNSRSAVITGDLILARSISIGLDSAQFDIVGYIVRAMSELCEGELIQSEQSRRLEMTRDIYLDIVHKKTGVLFGVSAGSGALSVGASREDVVRMQRFGEYAGTVFQIKDDILDYDARTDTGKPAGNDLKEKKITLPLLAVLEKSSPARRAELLERLSAVGAEPSNIDYLHDVVISEGGVREAEKVLNDYIDRARSALSSYAPSPYLDSLLRLASYAGRREK